MEFAKYAISVLLLASVLSCAQVSCDDKDRWHEQDYWLESVSVDRASLRFECKYIK